MLEKPNYKKNPSYPTVTIRTRDKNKPPVGANTEVFLDGKRVPFCCSVKFQSHARKISRITIEMYGYAEVEAMGDYNMKIIPLKAEKGKRRGRKA